MKLFSIVLGKGPAIIILHGLFGEGKNWLSIAKVLQSNFEVHLLDQRNHGQSFHHTHHDYSVLAQDVHQYVKNKSISCFSLIGHSMGGKVAMSFACLYPDYINKLIIVDISPKLYKDNYVKLFSGLKTVLIKSKSRKEATQILMDYVDDSIVVNFLLKGLYFDEQDSPKLKFNVDNLEMNIDKMLSFPVFQNTFEDVVYFLSGSKSNYINPQDSRDISKLFSIYEIITIKDAGHWVHFDQKENFLSTINEILKPVNL
tara:strand:- start:637 stop:1407 length:771 start_codon:yes stop_codon:yes gene_type:complete